MKTRCINTPFFALAAGVLLAGAARGENQALSLEPSYEPAAWTSNFSKDFSGRVAHMVDAAPKTAAPEDDNALAEKLNDPISHMISIPFQYNADFNAGVSGSAHRSYMNIQPVIPFSITDNMDLIVRTIIPLIYQEELAPGQGDNWGLGDTAVSMYFVPKGLIPDWKIGIGPQLLFPTGTDTALGGGKWGAGPSLLILQQKAGWTYGMLANHVWSYCGDQDTPYVNATFLQPFIAYQFPTATTIGMNTETTYDWRSSQFTTPINVFVSQVMKIGGKPISFQLGGRYYAEGPSGGPEWGVRFTTTFIIPE